MDQTFSARNLRRAWDLETRKGTNLARKLQRKGNPIDIDLHALKRNYSNTARNRKLLRELRKSGGTATRVKNALTRLEKLQTSREQLIEKFLARVQDSLEDPTFALPFSKRYRTKRVDVFDLDDPYPINYIALKALSGNLRRAFRIRPADRDRIVGQMSRMLNDHYPKSVIRADVSKFYESIDHDRLVGTLRASQVLSTATLRLITKVLRHQAAITGLPRGLPRGLGLSADLSEIFMSSFDDHFRQLESTVFYARFVDDVILISRPGSGQSALDVIRRELNERGLRINMQKSHFHEMKRAGSIPGFTFLGYLFEYRSGRLLIRLSPTRVRKIERRLDASFGAFAGSKSESKLAKIMLMKRVRFLTTNTRLANNKRRAYVGIRFSNRFVNDGSQLADLDARLRVAAGALADLDLARKLNTYGFVKGWEDSIFVHHTLKDFDMISTAWKNVG